ncbi:MAG TPA: universal stress protein [Lacisediminihabitans sp.]|uniref:universal stress protein n=1 Tax=Lacisediminihabitans sp. TaxID=2787631 RepID=UPI002ED95CED
MTRKAVVAIDGGIASEAALGWAIDAAVALSLDLEIVCVLDVDHASPDELERLAPRLHGVLDDAVERVAHAAPSVHAVSVLRRGRRRAELVNASEDAVMLIVGSDKPKAAAGLVHGTLSLQLADSVHSPLVIVPKGWTHHGDAVVVGQGDETDADALLFAVRQAESSKQPLRIARAWQVSAMMDLYLLGRGYLQPDTEKFNRQLLNDNAATIRRAHPQLTVQQRLHRGDTSSVMAEEASKASLVVVGTHRRGPLSGFLLGSIGHDLLMELPCPIAVVPPGTHR